MCLLVVLNASAGMAQDSVYYAVYTSKGKPVEIKTMIDGLEEQDIILFGELHNDQTLHKIQLLLAQKLSEKKPLMMGAEMLERHNQNLIDEYLQGIIDTTQLFKEADLWPNFKSDYLPLLDLAKEKNLPFVASNIPRTLAKIAAFNSINYLDSIATDSIRLLMNPFPFEMNNKVKPYKELIKSDFGASHGMDTKKIVAAQALKDATMAHSICKNLEDTKLFLHYNGDFHSKDFGGIVYWLNHYTSKKLEIGVISTVESDNLEFKKDWKKQADYIIVVLKDGPKSY